MPSANKLAITALLSASLFSASNLIAAEKAILHERAPASQKVDFDIYLPLEHQQELESTLRDLQDPKSPTFHKWLKPAEFHQRFGASSEKIEAVQRELSGYGLTTTHKSPQRIHVTGTAANVERVFLTELHNATLKNGKTVAAATRGVTLPSAMSNAHGVLVGLSSKVHMQPQSRKLPKIPANRYSPLGGYWFDDLKQAYKYPGFKQFTGKGAIIGILMETGFSSDDMDQYFGHEKLATPHIEEVDVDGGAPYDPDFLETALDLQQSGGMAPNADLVLFNIPSLADSDILSGLTEIVESDYPDVVNMSFGGPELLYTKQYNDGVDFTGILTIFDDFFKQGNAEGMTFVASSGDSGGLVVPPVACFAEDATETCGKMRAGVQIPASSPHVVAVGGTNLVTTSKKGSLNSNYVSENAHSDPLLGDLFFGTLATGAVWGSGGGNSVFFPKPVFQQLVDTGSKFRTVPDVSLHMGGCPYGAVDPCGPNRSFVYAVIGGEYYGVIGTSASSPDFAGLLALKIEHLGTRLGNENFNLYALAALQADGAPYKVFRDNIPGDNGAFYTKKGYNRVLGNGTVIGVNYMLAPLTPVAGTPQTPSNP